MALNLPIQVYRGTLANLSALATTGKAGVLAWMVPASPFIIGPNQFGLIYLWFPSNVTTGASFSNLHLAWWER